MSHAGLLGEPGPDGGGPVWPTLEPCPFCGKSAAWIHCAHTRSDPPPPRIQIHCGACGASMRERYGKEQQLSRDDLRAALAKRWNSRPTPNLKFTFKSLISTPLGKRPWKR